VQGRREINIFFWKKKHQTIFVCRLLSLGMSNDLKKKLLANNFIFHLVEYENKQQTTQDTHVYDLVLCNGNLMYSVRNLTEHKPLVRKCVLHKQTFAPDVLMDTMHEDIKQCKYDRLLQGYRWIDMKQLWQDVEFYFFKSWNSITATYQADAFQLSNATKLIQEEQMARYTIQQKCTNCDSGKSKKRSRSGVSGTLFSHSAMLNLATCPDCRYEMCVCCHSASIERCHYGVGSNYCPLLNRYEAFDIPYTRIEEFWNWKRYCWVLVLNNYQLAFGQRISLLHFQLAGSDTLYELKLSHIALVVFISGDSYDDNRVFECLAFRHWSPYELQSKIQTFFNSKRLPGVKMEPKNDLFPPIIPMFSLHNTCDQCNKKEADSHMLRFCKPCVKNRALPDLCIPAHSFCLSCVKKMCRPFGNYANYAPCLVQNENYKCTNIIQIDDLCFECSICWDEKPKVRVCSSQKHIVCIECLVQHVRSKHFHQATICPGCNYSIDISNLEQDGLSLEWYEGLVRSLFAQQLFKCPLCGTMHLQESKEKHDWFECQNCKHNICCTCQQPMHEGTPCEIPIAMVEDIASFNLPLTQCPNCNEVMEVDPSFCNKVICLRCKEGTSIFCALCKKTFGDEKECYRHFCRTLEESPITCSSSSQCSHCYIWPTKDAGARAHVDFLKEFPQFKIQ